MKIVSWLVSTALVLVLAGLAWLYFAPGYGLFLVRSESMKPTINMGDLIITGPVNGPISGGVTPETIVTYEHRKELITHRVQAINGQILLTKGDAVEDPDPWTVSMADVKGIYLFKIPSVGYALKFVQSKLGWFLTIIAPGTLLVLWLIKDILKEAFNET